MTIHSAGGYVCTSLDSRLTGPFFYGQKQLGQEPFSSVFPMNTFGDSLPVHFPGGLRLADTRASPFRILSQLRVMEVVVTTEATRRAKLNQHPVFFLQAGCHSCHPTNSVKALKGMSERNFLDARCPCVARWRAVECRTCDQ